VDNTNDILLKQVVDILNQQGENLVTDIRNAIQAKNRIATGALLNSVVFEVVTNESVVTLNINALEYLKWVDLGRAPGGKQIPIQALEEWIEIRGIRSRKDLNKSPGKDKLPDSNTQLAWAFAKSIQRKGIPKTNVIQNPFNKVKDKNADEISMALATGNHNATGAMLDELAAQYKDNNITIEIIY
jgi:hypothetical protein